MPYVDKVTVDNTTYDIRDTTTAQEVSDLESATEQNTDDISGIGDIVSSTLVTKSVSGSTVVIADGAANAPIKSLLVNLEPIQPGSGDPSPDNVRPISGVTSVTITRTVDGSSTEFEVEIPSAVDTVYGGTLDVATGVLTVTTAMETFDGSGSTDLAWFGTPYNGVRVYRANMNTGGSPKDDFLSNILIGSNARGVAASAEYSVVTYSSATGVDRNFAFLRGSWTSLSEFNAFCTQTPIQLVYPVAPVTYQIGHETIEVLQRENTFTSSSDTITVEYYVPVDSAIDSKLLSASVDFYTQFAATDPSAIVYLWGERNIGFESKTHRLSNVSIVHPSGPTSSSSYGVGVVLSVLLKSGSTKNVLVDTNIFPQSHASAHEMELCFNITQLPFKLLGSVDYYCDGVFAGRYNVDISETSEIDAIYAVGGYFNTESASRTYTAYGECGSSNHNYMVAI